MREREGPLAEGPSSSLRHVTRERASCDHAVPESVEGDRLHYSRVKLANGLPPKPVWCSLRLSGQHSCCWFVCTSLERGGDVPGRPTARPNRPGTGIYTRGVSSRRCCCRGRAKPLWASALSQRRICKGYVQTTTEGGEPGGVAAGIRARAPEPVPSIERI